MITIFSLIIILPLIIWIFKGSQEPEAPIIKEKILPIESTDFFDNDEEFIKQFIQESNNIDNIKTPLEITIKSNSLDPNLIHEYKGDKFTNFEFRPKTFKEFIGQESGKNKARGVIKRVNRNIKSHLFITGSQGLGKTCFLNILANELNAKLIERIGNQVNSDTIIPTVNEIIDSKEKNIMLFVDEIDGMKPEDIKTLNTVIESFKLAGRDIRPFIFACATINDEKLYLNNPDFLDRIPIKIQFQKYNSNEISQIILQAKNQLYKDDKVSNEVIKLISENCKFNPRVANSLLSDYIIDQNIQQVFKDNQIVKDGLTITDIKILNILNQQIKPIGEAVLSQKVGLKRKQYNIVYEPYLVEYGYINRIPSRIITDKGKEILSII